MSADASPATSRPRICLGAIAKDEGPYLVDWIFHHLHFGFDAITLWVNGTTDPSLDILERVRAVEPRVRVHVADDLLDDSIARGKSFQRRAYQQMARRAEKEGFTHLACLDLDEYWTPRDLRSSIHDFVDPEVAVTAFGRCLDVPDAAAPAYRPLMEARPALQRERHVKSVVRLGEDVVDWRSHTAQTLNGPIRLVRDEFPLDDLVEQQYGSFVTHEWLAAHHHELPEAFVVHAVHRSRSEYISTLMRGRRHTGDKSEVNNNRHGFMPNAAPRLAFPSDAEAVLAYLGARARFHEAVGAQELIAKARRQAVERGQELIRRAVADPAFLQQARKPLRNVPVPELDAVQPGWDTPLFWRLDTVKAPVAQPQASGGWLGRVAQRFASGRRAETQQFTDATTVEGWAFDENGAEVEFAFRDGEGTLFEGVEVERLEHPEVALVFPAAPLMAGLRLTIPPEAVRAEEGCVLARTVGTPFWEESPLPL